MSNFDFLESNKLFRSFAKASIEAEKGLETNPVTCIMLSRKALELGVKWLYANDKLLLMPYQTTLSALTHTITFKNIVDDEVRKGIDFVIKMSRRAVAGINSEGAGVGFAALIGLRRAHILPGVKWRKGFARSSDIQDPVHLPGHPDSVEFAFISADKLFDGAVNFFGILKAFKGFFALNGG